MELVSIIVPVYNTEKYLNRCIKSLINQTYKNIEIILVNDGSTDTSGKICDEYAKKDSRVKVFHKINEGVSVARNYGISKCSGDLIQFVDSDDFLSLDSLETINNITNKEIDLISFSHVELGVKSKTIHALDDMQSEIPTLLANLSDLKHSESILCTVWNKVYKKNIIKNNSIMFKAGMKLGEDFLFNLEYLLYVKNIKTISAPLYYYDISNDNSAVKRFYLEIEEYISYMRNAIRNLLKKYNQEDCCCAKGYFDDFINRRYDGALNICIFNKCDIKIKLFFINNLIQNMPKYDFYYAKQKENMFTKFVIEYTKRGYIKKGFVRYIMRFRRKSFITIIKEKLWSILNEK